MIENEDEDEELEQITKRSWKCIIFFCKKNNNNKILKEEI